MKKRNLICFIGIGLLAFIPFVRVTVAAPPAWVGVQEDDIYIWTYTNHSAEAAGAWTTDGVSLSTLMVMGYWCGPLSEDMAGYGIPGNMSHEIDTVSDLGPDLEYGSNYQSVEVIHAMVWNYTGGSDAIGGGPGGYNWDDKVTGTNIHNGLIIENGSEYALFHDNLTRFFQVDEWHTTSMWVNPNIDWSEVVTTANLGLAAFNATATVVTDGFKITIPADAWNPVYNTTEAIGLTMTFDECGLLDTYDVTYGTDTIMDIDQLQGAQCTPAPPGIPGYELPIVIGVASIISLILIKKIKKK